MISKKGRRGSHRNINDKTVLTLSDQCSRHIDTCQLICTANQLTGFHAIGENV